MPLKSRGSVSARLRVWFSERSRAENASAVAARTSMPPRSRGRSAASPCTKWIAARRVVPASVSARVPFGKSKVARGIRPGPFAPRASQRSRPAIMRWMARKSPSPRSKTMRLPSRRSPATVRPSAAAIGGSTVRRMNGLRSAIRSTGRPRIRRSSASM